MISLNKRKHFEIRILNRSHYKRISNISNVSRFIVVRKCNSKCSSKDQFLNKFLQFDSRRRASCNLLEVNNRNDRLYIVGNGTARFEITERCLQNISEKGTNGLRSSDSFVS